MGSDRACGQERGNTRLDHVELTEPQLAAALEQTFGITAGHAAEIAAAHHARLPADADRIPVPAGFDPESVWRR